jgi:hypothetical protein
MPGKTRPYGEGMDDFQVRSSISSHRQSLGGPA